MVGPCSQQRGWFSESPPRQKPCVCSRVVPTLFKDKKPSSVFKGVNTGLGTTSNSTCGHLSPVIGQFWNLMSAGKCLVLFLTVTTPYLPGPAYGQLQASVPGRCLAQCLRMRKDTGKKEKSVLLDKQTFYVDHGQLAMLRIV